MSDTFTFDAANRMIASSVGGIASAYTYDGLGRRVRESAATATIFHYDHDGVLLYQQDEGAGRRTSFIHFAGSLVAERSVPYGGTGGGTEVIYQHTDALGTPVARTTATQAVTYRRTTAFGEPADGVWHDGPGYTGHVVDAGSRLVYMQQRYYDPAIGRFLSVDPMASDMTTGWNFNRYNYGANNPYRFTDPDGRAVCAIAPPAPVCYYAALKVVAYVTAAVATVWGAKEASDALNQRNESAEGQSDEGSDEASPRGRGVRPPNDTVDLEEDLAVGEIVGNLEAGGGEDISGRMNDPRYDPETGTQDKVRDSHSHPDGTVAEVHADRDRRTGALTDVKIKDPPDNQRSRGR